MPKKVNLGILGEIEVADDTGIATRPNVGNNAFNAGTALGSYAMRESGLEREVVKNDRIITALDNPKKYLGDKNAKLRALDVKLANALDGELIRGIQLGYSNDKATDLARKHMINEKNRLTEEIEKDYPMEIVEIAKNKLIKQQK